MTDLIRNGQAARSDQSTADLVKQAADQISRLVRDELRLAQAELTRKGKQAGADPVVLQPTLINDRTFRIPFDIHPDNHSRIQQVVLLASTDQGETWRECARAVPSENNAFTFRAPADGEYWLSVDVLSTENESVEVESRPTVGATAPVVTTFCVKPPVLLITAANLPPPLNRSSTGSR